MIIDKIYSDGLKREVKISILLPNDYTTKKKYPVLYMHDGQNLFDSETATHGETWRVEDALKYKLPEMIVVGMDSAEWLDRLDEYSPYVNSSLVGEHPSITRPVGGKGDKYLEFVVNIVKPMIDKNYSTLPDRDNTAIMGSSLGGLISLYAAINYNDIFSMYGCLSNAFWFALDELKNDIEKADLLGARIYMDAGTDEADEKRLKDAYLFSNNEIFKTLSNSNAEANYAIIKDGTHREEEWALRLPGVIKWLFGVNYN